MKGALLLCAVIMAVPATAAPPSTCGALDDYGKALCDYQRRNFTDAEAGFRSIVDRNEPDSLTIRAVYFLARTQMKRGRFEEASTLLIRIYSLDKAFYDAWSCDFLLGECRRETGRE